VRVAVTGYARLTPESAAPIFAALAEALRGYPTVDGITCLAPGADQLFARAVLAVNGTYDVVLPARDYRARKIPPDDIAGFDDLLCRARRVSVLPYERSGRPAYLAASREMLRGCDVLIAVWDQESARGRSCTSEVVALARRQGLDVVVIWPSGAERMSA
jgi:hypothetical protein